MSRHRLLLRQLKKLDSSVADDTKLQPFFQTISDAYVQSDRDRELLERSLELTSRELTERNRELQSQLAEQERTKEALLESHSLLHASLESMHDGLLVLDMNMGVRLYNPMFCSIFDIPDRPEKLKSLDDIFSNVGVRIREPGKLQRALRESAHSPEQHREFEIRLGGHRFIEAYSSPQLFGHEIVGQVWSFRDVSDLRLKEEESRHRAYHDLLTGLPNRRLLMMRLNQALEKGLEEGKKTAVLFFDLDGFKDVNDYLGHGTGDALLKDVAHRLEQQMPHGTLLCRHGGDEFVAVMERQEDESGAIEFANQVLDAFARPFQLANDELFMTSSIGLALGPEHGDDADKLISSADIAMYRAKDRGKNGYAMFSSELDNHSVHRLKIRSQINIALEKNQFELFFQPKVDLQTGRIIGAEALIRWRVADGEYRSPLEFIPIAEENGQIIPISQWLIRQCCHHLNNWAGFMPKDFVLALNISAKHFQRGALQIDLTSALEETGADAHKLEFEVTETAIMDDVELAVLTLKELSRIGIRTAIDDFGTGYSSLSYLRRLPIEILKIDKSFVDEILISDEDRTLVKGIIDMVHALGIEVVAEGVENRDMADLLRTMNCDLVQGYHYCPPVPEAEFIELLKANKTYPV